MGMRDVTAKLDFHRRVVIRASGFVLVTVFVGGALALGGALRDPVRAPTQSAVAGAEKDEKDQTRVVEPPAAAAQTGSIITGVSIWHPGKMEHAALSGESPGTPDPVSIVEPRKEWREQEFAAITVIDGRTFTSDGLTITLADLEVPPADEVCRTLDNRLEQCAVRAATQLDLLTRSRKIACRFQMTTSSEATGSCRIGSQDLAQRLIRTGYVRAAHGGKTTIASAKDAGAIAH